MLTNPPLLNLEKWEEVNGARATEPGGRESLKSRLDAWLCSPVYHHRAVSLLLPISSPQTLLTPVTSDSYAVTLIVNPYPLLPQLLTGGF